MFRNPVSDAVHYACIVFIVGIDSVEVVQTGHETRYSHCGNVMFHGLLVMLCVFMVGIVSIQGVAKGGTK